MKYFVFTDYRSGIKSAEILDMRAKAAGHARWAELWEHPSDLQYALPYDESRIGPFDPGVELIDETEAVRRGFHFGPLNGRFYRALNKCVDATIQAESLQSLFGAAPFPIMRSLFLGAVGSMYAAAENVKDSVLGPAARGLPQFHHLSAWWQSRSEEMHRKGELLHYFRTLNNAQKHGSAQSVSTALAPKARFRQGGRAILLRGGEYVGDALGLRLGAEGVFVSKPFVGNYEHWSMQPNDNWAKVSGFDHVQFEFDLIGLPEIHLGSPLRTKDPAAALLIAVEYHLDLVRGAIVNWEIASNH